MKRTLSRRLLAWLPVLFVGLLLFADAKPAHASPCFTGLADCYFRAAGIPDGWYRTWAGFDCEVEFVGCLRRTIGGW